MKLPDEQFMAYVGAINSQCAAHAKEWNLDTDRLEGLQALTLSATAAYEANLDRTTRNHLTATHKKAVFSQLKRTLALFIDYLEGHLAVPDEALSVMSLRSRTRPAFHRLPRPGDAPLVGVVKQRDEMTVYVSRSELGHPAQSAAPKKYHGFKLRWKYEGEPVYRTEISTRLRYTLFFERSTEVRRILFSVAWVNPRLEEGPWTEDLLEVIG